MVDMPMFVSNVCCGSRERYANRQLHENNNFDTFTHRHEHVAFYKYMSYDMSVCVDASRLITISTKHHGCLLHLITAWL